MTINEMMISRNVFLVAEQVCTDVAIVQQRKRFGCDQEYLKEITKETSEMIFKYSDKYGKAFSHKIANALNIIGFTSVPVYESNKLIALIVNGFEFKR